MLIYTLMSAESVSISVAISVNQRHLVTMNEPVPVVLR